MSNVNAMCCFGGLWGILVGSYLILAIDVEKTQSTHAGSLHPNDLLQIIFLN